MNHLGELLNEDVRLTKILASTENIQILSTKPIQAMIKFKWDLYGKNHHLFSLWFHFLYTLIIIVYVKQVNMEESDNQHLFALLLCVGIVYSGLYDIG